MSTVTSEAGPPAAEIAGLGPRPPVHIGYAVYAEGLIRHFGGVRAVDGVDIRIPAGEIYGFLGLERRGQVDDGAHAVHADALGRPIGTYSGGMKRRLDLAAALVHNPEIVFLDEPTTGLDPASRARLRSEIRRLNQQLGMTIFLTTQYLEEADELAHRVGIIDHGSIVAEGTPADLKRSVGSDVIVARLDSNAAGARPVVEAVPGVRSVEAHGNELVIATRNGAAAISGVAVALAEHRRRVQPGHLSARRPAVPRARKRRRHLVPARLGRQPEPGHGGYPGVRYGAPGPAPPAVRGDCFLLGSSAGSRCGPRIIRPAVNLWEQQCVSLGNARRKVMGGQLMTKVQAVDSAKRASKVQRPFLDLQGWLLRQRFFTSKVLPAMPRRLRWALRRGYFAPVDLIERFRRGDQCDGAGLRAAFYRLLG